MLLILILEQLSRTTGYSIKEMAFSDDDTYILSETVNLEVYDESAEINLPGVNYASSVYFLL